MASEGEKPAQRGPLASTFDGPARPVAGRPLTLTARVVRRQPSPAAIHVTLHLPTGVRLLEGTLDQFLPAAEEPRDDALTFVVLAESLPQSDAVLTVHVRGAGFGYHAAHVYRFGRAAPPLVTPVRDEAFKELNGRPLARPVRVGR